jgi:hypothetical protein
MTELTGRAKGGAARAAKLTAERRKEIAMKAVDAKRAKAILPKASHRGELKIGDIEIPCAVLENGERILSELGVNATLGSAGGKSYRLRDAAIENNSGPMPLFLASKALQPFINEAFEGVDFAPVEYLNNGVITTGYKASILPQVCEVWLKAKDAGALQGSQLPKAKKAEILMRGLAQIGIIALVDEATGYQKDREKDALAKILEAFVAKELQPYLKAFPSEYYEHLFRLYGYSYPPKDKRPQWRPAFFGIITNEVVYKRLAPGILPELKKLASKAEKKAKLMQGLTLEVGHPKLKDHLISIVSLLKISTSPQQFRAFVNQVHPRFGDTPELPFIDSDNDK